MERRLEKRLNEARDKKYIVFLPNEDVNVEGYTQIPKIGGTVASSLRDAIGHYLFRFTRAFDFHSKLITESNARLILSILNKDLGGAEKYAYEIPELYQDEVDLKAGERIDKTTFKAHQRLMIANYFENIFRRRVTDREYWQIRRILNSFHQ